MSDLRPLAIHGTIQPGDVEAIKAAKAKLDVPFKVTICEAFPGGPVRVLALRHPPPFLCDYALARDPQNPVALEAALAWVLDEENHDPRAKTLVSTLQDIFGPDLKEITDVYQERQPTDEELLNPPPQRRYDPND